MRVLATLLAALVILNSVQGSTIASWYSCSPSSCKLPSCHCASEKSPLPVSETPQFVIISNDDSVDQDTANKMEKIVGSFKNTNGCPIPATWFTLTDYSSCSVVKKRFKMGDEFACHTLTHQELKPTLPKSVVTKEIVGSKNYLVKTCGLPAASVTGFRAPYLTTNPQVRQVLYDNGFRYDSSNGFDYAAMSNKPFPFTLDAGLPDTSCSNCKSSEKYKGMWEIPVYNIKYNGQTYSMDPGMKTDWGDAKELPVEDVMIGAFNEAYNGNRAPVPLGIHVYWMTDKHIKGAQKFIKYALSKPNTYFVTYRQVMEWMKNPVPNSEMAAWLKARCKI